ncbi:hypothetical protein [Streptomyces acidiscabies]|uniref:Uncharacterized protein n=1 Tax=Streptomyces acidiscabies TaxID=42234 RepID=A0ABU4LWG1_9ACTN|nr:hypothetical protein [Streptomyces acidiscabies]MDX3020013.1 hypothetical protein [Streptomyces acidiscabies]
MRLSLVTGAQVALDDPDFGTWHGRLLPVARLLRPLPNCGLNGVAEIHTEQ